MAEEYEHEHLSGGSLVFQAKDMVNVLRNLETNTTLDEKDEDLLGVMYAVLKDNANAEEGMCPTHAPLGGSVVMINAASFIGILMLASGRADIEGVKENVSGLLEYMREFYAEFGIELDIGEQE